jgi:ankyrin repeat protein
VIELLLNFGATVNIQTSSGSTPLHRAAYCGHVAVTDLLLKSGANPNLPDSDGKIALHKVNNKVYSVSLNWRHYDKTITIKYL